MGWLSNKIDRLALSQQEAEMNGYLTRLRAMDGSEIGMILVLANYQRQQLKSEGYNVFDAIVCAAQTPRILVITHGAGQAAKIG